jgi:hypothetical protein
MPHLFRLVICLLLALIVAAPAHAARPTLVPDDDGYGHADDWKSALADAKAPEAAGLGVNLAQRGPKFSRTG